MRENAFDVPSVYGTQNFVALKAIAHAVQVNSSFFANSGRHTSSTRDWSSDVCSSDLRHEQRHILDEQAAAGFGGQSTSRQRVGRRSEERRVGKEGRSRWSPEHYKK